MARLLTNPIALKQIVQTLAENRSGTRMPSERFPRSRAGTMPRRG